MAPHSKNHMMLIAIALPAVFALAVAAAVLIPRYFGKPPAHDFLYVTGGAYYGASARYDLAVSQGKLTVVTRECPSACHIADKLPSIFRYDSGTGQSREITLEAAQGLRLDPSERSPDGYRLSYGDGNPSIFPIMMSGYNIHRSLHLVGPAGRFEINAARGGVPAGGYYYSSPYNVRLIGWIVKEQM